MPGVTTAQTDAGALILPHLWRIALRLPAWFPSAIRRRDVPGCSRLLPVSNATQGSLSLLRQAARSGIDWLLTTLRRSEPRCRQASCRVWSH